MRIDHEALSDEALARQVRAERIKRALIIATAVGVAAALVLIVFLIASVRATQQDGSPAVKAARDAAQAAESTNRQILDCLNPDGECYKQSQRARAGQAASINEITQYAAACADRPGSQALEEIRACVADLIAASASPAPVSP